MLPDGNEALPLPEPGRMARCITRSGAPRPLSALTCSTFDLQSKAMHSTHSRKRNARPPLLSKLRPRVKMDKIDTSVWSLKVHRLLCINVQVRCIHSRFTHHTNTVERALSISRVDYRAMSEEPLTKQTAAAPWDASRRPRRDPLSVALEESAALSERRHTSSMSVLG